VEAEKKPPGSGGLTTDSCWMSHHVTRGRLSVFGDAPAGADAGAPKRVAIPVGIMIRVFTIAASFLRRRQIGVSTSIRQGN
jgi:hypothetical protein